MRVKSLNDESVKTYSKAKAMGKGIDTIPRKGTTKKSKEKNRNEVSNRILTYKAIRSKNKALRIPTNNLSSGSGLQLPS